MNFKSLFRLLNSTRNLKLVAMLAGLVALAIPFLHPVRAHYMRHLVDTFLGDQVELYGPLAAKVILLLVLMSLLTWFRTKLMGRIAEYGSADLRRQAAYSLLDMPVPRLDAIHTGDHLSRLTNDISVVTSYLTHYLFLLFMLPLLALASLIYMAYINWQMILATVALMPLLIWLTAKASKAIGLLSKQLQGDLANVNNVTQDSLGGAEVVKAYNLQPEMERRFDTELDGVIGKGIALARRKVNLRITSIMAGFFPFLLPLTLGGWFAIEGRISVGELLAFIMLLNQLTFPLSQMPMVIGEHQRAMGALERIHQLIDEPPERTDGQAYADRANVVLAVENVAFGYDESPVLNGLSFTLKQGETVALVGPSGAGKTTVFKLLTGFYRPQQGQILLFGQPLAKWQLAAARKQMALVAQDTFLFPGTVAENIGLGRPDATREQIIAAARQANAHEFISQLPDGYDHLVGERGINLSGGQRQRIAIARAVLLDAPLLLLDEATSALDTQSERLVQEALDAMAANRTTLVIAHRLSTIRSADRVLVLDQGRIVESGTHQQLLDQGGLYRQLYLKQFNEEVEAGGAAS